MGALSGNIFMSSYLTPHLTISPRQAGAQCPECCVHGSVWGRGGSGGARADQGSGPRPGQRGDGHHQVSQGERCLVIMWRCLRSAGGGGGSDGADGGGGFDMGGVIKMIGGMKQYLNL